MDKFAEILDSDIDSLISRLLGKTIPSMPKAFFEPAVSNEVYQLPVKHTKGGVKIDDDHKPWVVGDFLPGRHVNETHPQGHDGVDLKSDRGTPIYPIASGEVVEARQYGKGGNTCKVAHENGLVVSYYAHMDSVSVSVGQEVTQSTVLGKMGDTGNAKGRGSHLHYEVKVNGKKIDPLSIVGKRVGTLSKRASLEGFLVKALDETVSNDRKNVLKRLSKQVKS